MSDLLPAPDPPVTRPRIGYLWKVGTVFLTAAGVLDAGVNVLLLQALGRPSPLWFVATATVPPWLALAALLPLAFLMAERLPFHDRPFVRTALMHLSASIALSALHQVLSFWLSDVLLSTRAADLGAVDLFWRGVSNYFVFDVLMYAGIVALYYAFDYQQRYREQTEAAARLQVQLAGAQLQALRTQLDPHFLFNALNAISGTALRRDPERTAGLISDLSQLLRRSLRQPAAEVALEEELEFLSAYLSIERARMGGRLRVEVDAPADLLGHPVPSLLLQPLAENAIRHGLSEKVGGGSLWIRVRAHEDRIEVDVQDDGCGFDPSPREGAFPAEGVGLGNTRARLRELYGEGGRITLSNRSEGGARVVVEIPAPGRSPRPTEQGGRVAWKAS